MEQPTLAAKPSREPKKCPGCGEMKEEVLFHHGQKDEKTRCVKCRIRANMNAIWWAWSKSTSGVPSVEDKKKDVRKVENDYLRRWKNKIRSWYTGPWPLSEADENDIRMAIQATAPAPQYLLPYRHTIEDEAEELPAKRLKRVQKKVKQGGDGTSRCPLCIKRHWACDKRRPCGRCAKVGRSAEECGDFKASASTTQPPSRTRIRSQRFSGKVTALDLEGCTDGHALNADDNKCDGCEDRWLPSYNYVDPTDSDYQFLECIKCRASGEAIKHCEVTEHVAFKEISAQLERGIIRDDHKTLRGMLLHALTA